MLKISNDENNLLQGKFRDFIIPTQGSRPMPLLMTAVFSVANNHLDITEESFTEMCDYEKSKERFSLYYALFLDVTDLSDAELINKKAEHGIKGRYLDKVFELANKKYLVCKEFYLNKGGYKIKLYEWICEIFGMDTIDFANDLNVDVAITDSDNGTDDVEDVIDVELVSEAVCAESNMEYSLEFLDAIRTSAACILLRVEKDAIAAVINSLRNGEECDEDQLVRVKNAIKKLKIYKETLENLEL